MMHGSPDQNREAHQKRRFVWTADLHARFEAAVNTLGLDNAKPKSILRLMSVEGLTKANIKSHLQKYRCLMQKRAAQGPPGPASTSVNGIASSTSSADGDSKHMDGSCASTLKLDSSPKRECPSPLSALSRTDDGNKSETALLSGEGGVAAYEAALDASELDGRSVCSSQAEQLRAASLSEDLVSQGECSLQRNLEVQELTLKVQMDLQEELSRQLQMQKRLQAEMEGMMLQRPQGGDSEATSTKMSNILSLKHKLQNELQAHLRMQHQMLAQLNHTVMPTEEASKTTAAGLPALNEVSSGVDAPAEFGDKADYELEMGASLAYEAAQGFCEQGGGEDGEDDGEDDDIDDDESETGAKRQRT